MAEHDRERGRSAAGPGGAARGGDASAAGGASVTGEGTEARPLRVLHLEDNPLDAELTVAYLQDAGVHCRITRVQTRGEFVAAVADGCGGGDFDLILADYSLPAFDGLEALTIARAECPELPFVFLSGAIGEERAIEALRTGAVDYVLKDRLGRLGPAVLRAVQEVRERRERRRAEEALRASEDRFRLIVENARDFAIFTFALDGRVTSWNPGAERIFGYPEADILGRDARLLFTPEDRAAGVPEAEIRAAVETGRGGDDRWHLRRGGRFFASGLVAPLRDEAGTLLGFLKILRDITEARRIAEALRASEERLRFALRAAGMAAWDWDEATGRVRRSGELAELLGPDAASESEGGGGGEADPLFDHIHPEDRPAVLAAFREALEGGREYRQEYRIVRPGDGAVRWVADRGRLISEAPRAVLEGDPAATGGADADPAAAEFAPPRAENTPAGSSTRRMSGVMLDITARKTAELDLARSRERLELAQEAGDIGAFDWDMRTNAVAWSSELEALYGFPVGGFGGSYDHWRQAVHPDDRGWTHGHAMDAASGKHDLDMEFRALRPDGSLRWIVARGRTYRDAAGHPARMVGINFDVTERREAEDALARSEERYRLAARATNDAIWDWDLPKGRVAWNEAVGALFGYGPDAINPDPSWWEERVHPEDRGRVVRGLDAVIESGEDHWQAEYRFRRADGSYAEVFDRGYALRDAAGVAVRMIGAIADLTPRKRAEEELRRLNATLEERVAERTAQLRRSQEQLRALAAELTRSEGRERRRIAESLHDDLAQSLVISQMKLALIRAPVPAETAARTIEEIRTSLNAAVQYTRSLMQELSPPMLYDLGLEPALEWLVERLGQQHGLKVALRDDGADKPASEETRTVLFTATRELLVNVVKYAGVREAVVDLRREGETIRLSVEDRGAGFDLAKTGLRPTDQGGFGLFSIRERLDLLGGRMEIDTTPGGGTRVTLSAPLAVPPPRPRAAKARKA